MPFTDGDVAADKLLSNSSPTHRVRHNNLGTAVKELKALVLDARDLGSFPDSSSDELAHLQAAVDQLGAAGGGIIRLLPGEYLVSDSLLIDASNVVIEGAGMTATTIKKSSGTNTPVKIVTNLVSTKIVDAGVRRLTIDANSVAHYALRVTTANYLDISRLVIKGADTYQVLMDCEDDRPVGWDARDNQHCSLRDLKIFASGSAGGIRLHGNSDAAVTAGDGANSSYNDLRNIWVTNSGSGDAFSFGNSDNNESFNIRSGLTGAGTGRGLVLNGSSIVDKGTARENQFHGVSMANGSDIYALGGTTASNDNIIFGMSRGNGAVNDPHISSGAELWWKATDGTGNF